MKTFVAFASVLLATTGFAAETSVQLLEIKGSVLVNQGEGLRSGVVSQLLKAGDKIVTLNKSGARVTFSSGCSVNLQENQVFVIDSNLGCKAPILGSGAAPSSASPLAGVSGDRLVLGAAAFGTGLMTYSANKTPVSPH